MPQLPKAALTALLIASAAHAQKKGGLGRAGANLASHRGLAAGRGEARDFEQFLRIGIRCGSPANGNQDEQNNRKKSYSKLPTP